MNQLRLLLNNMRKPFVGGNWKMNGSSAFTSEYATWSSKIDKVDVMVSPPFVYLQEAAKKLPFIVAAQNCYSKESGAFTGEVSPQMLKDIGVKWVILGHSERRQLFGESSQVVAEKTNYALEQNLSVVVCIGETLEEREAGKTLDVINEQMEFLKGVSKWENIVIAYEPVWAIGTGKVATPEQAQEVHAHIRKSIPEGVRVIYGGSVKGSNAESLMVKEDIDGFLVGGASLKKEFFDICKIAANHSKN
eukprot:NODE_7_length_67686_cov_1.621421.p29 type:complete len:248 gc:universal NODE_7_length_67686_cov_1.621421:30146-30889(+)